MKKIYVLLLAAMLCGSAFNAMAQPRTVTGTVTEKGTGEVLAGVSVVVKGTTTAVATDADGKYNIIVPNNNVTLVFSLITFKTQEVPVGTDPVINVELEPEPDPEDTPN
jgi:hypothetical protein